MVRCGGCRLPHCTRLVLAECCGTATLLLLGLWATAQSLLSSREQGSALAVNCGYVKNMRSAHI